MSTQPSNEASRRHAPSVYTVMLIIATICMSIAVTLMFVEAFRWGPDFHNTRAAQPSITP